MLEVAGGSAALNPVEVAGRRHPGLRAPVEHLGETRSVAFGVDVGSARGVFGVDVGSARLNLVEGDGRRQPGT